MGYTGEERAGRGEGGERGIRRVGVGLSARATRRRPGPAAA